MALITCSECNFEVSDKASICPKCGNPLKTGINDNSTMLIEQTSKKLKLQQIYAICFIGLGIILAISVNLIFGAIVFAMGIIWNAVIAAKIWWMHK